MSATKRDSLKRMVRRGAHCPCADHPAPGVVYCKKSGTLCDAEERSGCCELSYETNKLIQQANAGAVFPKPSGASVNSSPWLGENGKGKL